MATMLTAQKIKQALKWFILNTFNHSMTFINKHPQLRQSLFNFLRSTGILKMLKKMYFKHFLKKNLPFSQYMIGPTITIDITEKQMTARAHAIYVQIKHRLATTQHTKAN